MLKIRVPNQQSERHEQVNGGITKLEDFSQSPGRTARQPSHVEPCIEADEKAFLLKVGRRKQETAGPIGNEQNRRWRYPVREPTRLTLNRRPEHDHCPNG